MKAILLAAGHGTRLRPLTDSVPKCLVPFEEKKLLDLWLSTLFSAGISEVLINTHYLADTVEKHIAQSPWHDRVHLTYEEELLGTGGTILANKDFILDEPFFLAHADNLVSFDLLAFIAFHQARPKHIDLTMMTFKTDAPQSCGIVTPDKNNILIDYHEKVENPPGNLANAAIYIAEPQIISKLEGLKKDKPDISADLIPTMIQKVQLWNGCDYLRDIGTLASYDQAQKDIKTHPALKNRFSA
jgi:mannose-1-phosphate guanylyltransferase